MSERPCQLSERPCLRARRSLSLPVCEALSQLSLTFEPVLLKITIFTLIQVHFIEHSSEITHLDTYMAFLSMDAIRYPQTVTLYRFDEFAR